MLNCSAMVSVRGTRQLVAERNLSRRRMLGLSENASKLEAGQTIIEPFWPNPNSWIIEEKSIFSKQFIQLSHLATSLLSRQVDSFRR